MYKWVIGEYNQNCHEACADKSPVESPTCTDGYWGIRSNPGDSYSSSISFNNKLISAGEDPTSICFDGYDIPQYGHERPSILNGRCRPPPSSPNQAGGIQRCSSRGNSGSTGDPVRDLPPKRLCRCNTEGHRGQKRTGQPARDCEGTWPDWIDGEYPNDCICPKSHPNIQETETQWRCW